MLYFTLLFLIKLAIYKSEDIIFIKSISRKYMVLKIKIRWASPFQVLSSDSWLISYKIGTFLKPCKEHILVVLLASFLPCGTDMSFRAEALLLIYYTPFLGLLFDILLTSISAPSLGVVYKRE